jgi:hypothetical protein
MYNPNWAKVSCKASIFISSPTTRKKMPIGEYLEEKSKLGSQPAILFGTCLVTSPYSCEMLEIVA